MKNYKKRTKEKLREAKYEKMRAEIPEYVKKNLAKKIGAGEKQK